MNDDFSKISWISPDGVTCITFNDGSGFFIEEGGAAGLSGNSEDVALTLPTGGQQLDYIDIKPIESNLKVFVTGDDYPEQAQERMNHLISTFSRIKPGTLTLDNNDGLIYSIPLRLRGDVEVPDIETTYDDTIQRTIPLVSDRGYWSRTVSPLMEEIEPGKFRWEYINDSILSTSGKLSWLNVPQKDAPIVNIDSGANFKLPKPADNREGIFTLDLHPRASMAIYDEDGTLDVHMWKSMRRFFYATDVQPGSTQHITVSVVEGANNNPQLTYEHKTLNPWRW